MAAERWRFAEFELDPGTGELVGPAGSVRLAPQPTQVLVHLLGQAGRLVTREELQRAVWPDTEVEFDDGLNFCIRQIRAALGEAASSSRFIETLPRRGYRFLVLPAAGPHATAPGAPERPVLRPSRSLWRSRLALLALLATPVAVGSLALWLSTARQPRAVRIAVLPLDSSLATPGAYERELTEALVAALATEPSRLEVIGPATTAAMAAERSDGQIARELDADYVLSGGRRSDGVFLQLVRSADGAHVYARVLAAEETVGLAATAAEEIRPLVLASVDRRTRNGGLRD